MSAPSLNFEEVHKSAQAKGGKCLSTSYRNVNEKLTWECELGHVWEAPYHTIRYSNSWCPHCKPLTLEEACSLAEAKGGKCLSTKYINAHEALEWECSEGHRWKAPLNGLKYDHTWCDECAVERSRLGIEVMQEYAKKNNGECLTKEYKNNNQVFHWKCERGHEWHGHGMILYTGAWCQQCPKENQYQKLKEIAQANNGELLDLHYVSHTTRMTFKCNKCDHVWQALPGNIKKGKWCSPCRRGSQLKTQDMRNLALDRGGKFLSPMNKGIGANYLWECAEGHQWKAKFLDAKEHWCRECSIRRFNILKAA